jgi:galactokinase
MERKEAVIAAFRQRFGREPALLVRAPGRINLLGEHVDYNEGWVLPAAIDRAVWLAVAPNESAGACIRALDLGEEAWLDLGALHTAKNSAIRLTKAEDKVERATSRGQEAKGDNWVAFPAGVAWALQEASHMPVGMDALFSSDVPIGAGVSSSAAVAVAFILAWEALGGLSFDGTTRARLGQRAENGFLGVQSGIMDQFASANGVAGHVICLDCRSLAYELLPVPSGVTLLVAASGVARALASSEYNLRRRQCEEAVRLLQQHLPHVRALRDVAIEQFERHAHQLPLELRRRAQHVVAECARVLAGVEALRRGDMSAFGLLVRQSHVSLRDLYEVSIPELDVLASSAWQVPGCYGARLMGAGFGGSVLVVSDRGAAAEVEHVMGEAFVQQFGRRPAIFACRVADGAHYSRLKAEPRP